MIRMIQSTSAGHAKAYFSDALVKSDYYLNDQELNGAFRGKLAARLGITGRATKDSFFALCENRHPLTGDALTPRTKEERTTGYDINFHCPKSVSVLHVLSKDDHIMQAFNRSVAETMADIEADSKTRVRKAGKYADRETGELIYVDFVHQTARPVDGSEPDPHLHAHCYVFNATWDDKEGRTKAGQFRDIKRDMPFYEGMFQKRLSDNLMALGYGIKPTGKSFELEGVPQRVIDLFSKRTDEIGRIAKEKGITDAKALGDLGARTRAKKQKGLSMTELKAHWRQQIKAIEPAGGEDGQRPVRFAPDKERSKLTVDRCIDHTLRHSFERASVVPYRRLLETACRHSIGSSQVTVASLAGAIEQDKRLIRIQERSQTVCTTKEVLSEEKHMVDLARAGKDKLKPLYDYEPVVDLTGQQSDAVRHILTTKDQVSIVRGAAGSGKTTLMREAVYWIEKKDCPVTVVAPTANASRGVLRGEGFDKAETVALFLASPGMQQGIRNGLLWVDEAGLLGTGDMTRLLDIAARQHARVVLGGDTRQHAAVVRGDALRILSTVGGIRSAEVSKIYRQKNAQYRDAVDELSKGNIKEGFDRLDDMGSIRTVDPLNPNEVLVDDYIETIKAGKTGLVISPTHKQSEEVTDAIRAKLRGSGMIGQKEVMIEKLGGLNLTEAQKSDWRNFQAGQVVQFNQNFPGIKRGSRWSVKSADDKEVQIGDGKRTMVLPIAKPGGYDLFEKKADGGLQRRQKSG